VDVGGVGSESQNKRDEVSRNRASAALAQLRLSALWRNTVSNGVLQHGLTQLQPVNLASGPETELTAYRNLDDCMRIKQGDCKQQSTSATMMGPAAPIYTDIRAGITMSCCSGVLTKNRWRTSISPKEEVKIAPTGHGPVSRRADNNDWIVKQCPGVEKQPRWALDHRKKTRTNLMKGPVR